MESRSPALPGRSSALRAAIDLGILVAAGVALLAGGSVIGQEDIAQRLVLPVRTLIILVLITWLLRRCGDTWSGLGLRLPRSLWRSVGAIVLGYGAVAAVATLLLAAVFPALGWSGETTGAFAHLRGDSGEYIYWLAVAWTCAAIGEELIFRGFVQSRLERLFGGHRLAVAAALVGQAALFGLSHAYQGPGGMVLTGATGLVLGGVYLASGRNLVICIVLHGLIDTISLTAIFLGAM